MQQNAEHRARRWVADPIADLTVDERSHSANYRGLLTELDAARARVAELEAQWAAWFRESADQADDLTEGQREGFRIAAAHLDEPEIRARVARIPLDVPPVNR